MLDKLKDLKNKFKILSIREQRKDLIFTDVNKDDLVSLITYLKDYQNFLFLTFITAVDRIEEDKFQLTYMLYNPMGKKNLAVTTLIERNDPYMMSIHHLWHHAATYQRELREMFGIMFPNSPRLEDPLFLEGWQEIPPMRRDFDTKAYSEKTFFPRPGRSSKDPAKFMRSKLYPDFPVHKEDK